MSARCPKLCYRKALILALLALAWLSGNNAFAKGIHFVRAKQENSKKTDRAKPTADAKKSAQIKQVAPAEVKTPAPKPVVSAPATKTESTSQELKAATDDKAKAGWKPALPELEAGKMPAPPEEGSQRVLPGRQATAEASVPAVTAPLTPVWHKLEMRLSGSMCYACLKDLEDSLDKVPGVYRAKIDKPETVYFQAVSPDVSTWALGIVLYDQARLPLDNLRAAIKQNGYHSYRIIDKALDSHPDGKDLKM